jgi:Flp pilus assembly pilin Flp
MKKTWLDDEEKRASVAFTLIAVIVMLALIGALSIVGLMLYLIF